MPRATRLWRGNTPLDAQFIAVLAFGIRQANDILFCMAQHRPKPARNNLLN